MTGLSVAVALAAAVAFGWSTALMHHSASGAPAAAGLRALLMHVVRQWRWLIGMAASLAGLVLHAVALHLGSLVVVQPLVVMGLVFSFLFRAALDHHLPSRRTMGWVVLTAVGLTLFLLAVGGTPTGGDRGAGAGTIVMLGAGAVVVATALVAASRSAENTGFFLGVAGGVVFGLIGGTLKATTDVAAQGLFALLTSWQAYLLVGLGASGFLLNQRAYQAAPLSRSLPVANTVNPLVAVVFGIVAFGERPPEDLAAIVAEVLGLAAVLVGVFSLARTEEVAKAS